MTLGFVGSIAMQDTARFAIKSSTGVHEAPPLSVLHTPPPTLPAHMVLGTVGCTTIARVRPPMLPGPIDTQPVCVGCSPAVGGSTGPASADGVTWNPVGKPAKSALLTDPRARTLSIWRMAVGSAFGGTVPDSSFDWRSRN